MERRADVIDPDPAAMAMKCLFKGGMERRADVIDPDAAPRQVLGHNLAQGTGGGETAKRVPKKQFPHKRCNEWPPIQVSMKDLTLLGVDFGVYGVAAIGEMTTAVASAVPSSELTPMATAVPACGLDCRVCRFEKCGAWIAKAKGTGRCLEDPEEIEDYRPKVPCWEAREKYLGRLESVGRTLDQCRDVTEGWTNFKAKPCHYRHLDLTGLPAHSGPIAELDPGPSRLSCDTNDDKNKLQKERAKKKEWSGFENV